MTKSKVIGEGSSGCVFKPALPCKNEKYDNKNKEVSKLIFKENYPKELKMNRYIQNIPQSNLWSSTWNKSCNPPTLKTLNRISFIEDCLEEKEYKKAQKLLIGDYSGISLKNYFEKTFSKKSFDSSKEFYKSFITFIPTIQSLFTGIMKLYEHKICHHDLNYHNITYKNKSCYMIDFGISCNFSEMNRFKKRIKRELKNQRIYLSYPYEYILMINKDDLKKEKTLFLEKEYKENHKLYRFIHETIFQRKNIDHKIRELLDRSFSETKLKLMIEKLDTYSLGMLFPILLIKTADKYKIPRNKIVKYFNFKKIIRFLNLCKLMTTFDYTKRITPQRAHDLFEEFLKSFQKKTKKTKKTKRKKKTNKKTKKKKQSGGSEARTGLGEGKSGKAWRGLGEGDSGKAERERFERREREKKIRAENQYGKTLLEIREKGVEEENIEKELKLTAKKGKTLRIHEERKEKGKGKGILYGVEDTERGGEPKTPSDKTNDGIMAIATEIFEEGTDLAEIVSTKYVTQSLLGYPNWMYVPLCSFILNAQESFPTNIKLLYHILNVLSETEHPADKSSCFPMIGFYPILTEKESAYEIMNMYYFGSNFAEQGGGSAAATMVKISTKGVKAGKRIKTLPGGALAIQQAQFDTAVKVASIFKCLYDIYSYTKQMYNIIIGAFIGEGSFGKKGKALDFCQDIIQKIEATNYHAVAIYVATCFSVDDFTKTGFKDKVELKQKLLNAVVDAGVAELKSRIILGKCLPPSTRLKMKIKLKGLNKRSKYTPAIQERLDRVLKQGHLTQLDDLLSNFFKTLVKIFDRQSPDRINPSIQTTFDKINLYMTAAGEEEDNGGIEQRDSDDKEVSDSLKKENKNAHDFIMKCVTHFGKHPKALLALLFHMDTASHEAVFNTLWNELYQRCIEQRVTDLGSLPENTGTDLLQLATEEIEGKVGKRKKGFLVKAGQGLKSTVSGNKRNDYEADDAEDDDDDDDDENDEQIEEKIEEK